MSEHKEVRVTLRILGERAGAFRNLFYERVKVAMEKGESLPAEAAFAREIFNRGLSVEPRAQGIKFENVAVTIDQQRGRAMIRLNPEQTKKAGLSPGDRIDIFVLKHGA